MTKSISNFSKVLCALLLCAGFVFAGCTEEPAPIAVTSVTLDSTSMMLVEGETQKLIATISPSNAENQKVIWTSSNSSIATVTEGVVTAIKAGTATITVKTDEGGKTATCNITVVAKEIPVTSVSLDQTKIELIEGDELTLTATVKPDNATNKNVSWASSDENIASVADGVVTAIKAGAATITVKTDDGAKTATCNVTVVAKEIPVTSVSLDQTEIELMEGDELTLTATVKPDNATNKNVSWSSNNSSVASVSNGKVTALKAGTATITVKSNDGDKTASCEVIVKEIGIPVTSLQLSLTSIKLYEGDKVTLIAKILPTDATDQNITWSSDVPTVACVNQVGDVLAISKGNATITATAGRVSARCDVRVVASENYVDEYGVDHGKGTAIGNAIWAPINCGYHETDYPYGKLYQWGRKYGQGYSGELKNYNGYDIGNVSDATYPSKDAGTIKEGGVSLNSGQSPNNKDIYFLGNRDYYNDWLYPSDSHLWNSGTESSPIKNNDNDPCPNGWRIPTQAELSELIKNYSNVTENALGICGVWFSGPNSYTDDTPQVFFPLAGYREFSAWSSGTAQDRGYKCLYWSSKHATNTTATNHSNCLEFQRNYKSAYGVESRSSALSVRCVLE